MHDINESNDVAAFHRKFGIEYEGEPRLLPGEVPDVIADLLKAAMEMAYAEAQENGNLASFRVGFMIEELLEYVCAHLNGDLKATFDALLDLSYVVHGAGHLQGLPWDRGWDHVQAANMAKARPEDVPGAERRHPMDVVKPPGWTAPDLQKALDGEWATLPIPNINTVNTAAVIPPPSVLSEEDVVDDG